jgi:Leucine-rich repeat (LRR) protein
MASQIIFRGLLLVATVSILVACQPTSSGLPSDEKAAEKLEKGNQLVADCRISSCSDLSIGFAELEDYSVLSELPHVTKLGLSYNTFENLEDISGMEQLQELRIVATRIRDVSALSTFKNLTALQVQSALAEDVRPFLPKLPKLQALSINLPEDGDVAFVRKLPKLKVLVLDGEQISDLGPLRKHPSLEVVSLVMHLPKDLSPFLEIPNLKKLKIFDWYEREDTTGLFEKLRSRGVVIELEDSTPIE